MEEKAYEMYLRTSRLDLDDYNNEVDEGLHITSMGGTWMSLVYGFGGMKVKEGLLEFNPFLPSSWKALSFTILYRGSILKVNINKKQVSIENPGSEDLDLLLCGSMAHLRAGGSVVADL